MSILDFDNSACIPGWRRWPTPDKIIRPKIKLPFDLHPSYTKDYLCRAMDKFIVVQFENRNLVIVASEEYTVSVPHTCKMGSDDFCKACEIKLKPQRRIIFKAELNEVPERLVLGPALAKTYKRKRWQTEHKAHLIQKKWNKRVVNKVELQPARVVEYYSLSLYQASILKKWMNDERN